MNTQLQAVEQEIKRLNGQSHDPSSANILALIQMLVDALKQDAIDAIKTKYPRE